MQLLAASDFKIPKVSKKVRIRQVGKCGRNLFECSTSSSRTSLSNACNGTAIAHCFLLLPRAPLGRDVHWKLELSLLCGPLIPYCAWPDYAAQQSSTG
jgi:hypothetical protein